MSESNITRVKAQDGSTLVYENGNLKEVISADGRRFGGVAKKTETEVKRQVIGEGKSRFLYKTVEVDSPKKEGVQRTVFVHQLVDVDEEQAEKYATVEHDGATYGIKRCSMRLSAAEAQAHIAALQRAF